MIHFRVCTAFNKLMPYHDKERERIVGAGGSVMIQRINGSLAVSRAFGDFEYKNVPGLEPNKQLVSPEPDVYVLERQKEKDEFLVVACDGIYDVMENEELCRFVESRLHVCDDLNQVCNDVLDACLSKGSRDNMTMIVVCFDAAPTIDKEKVASEAAWKAQMLVAINGQLLMSFDRRYFSYQHSPIVTNKISFSAAHEVKKLLFDSPL
ncbi:protein phosphatase 2C [Oesophagostomum dentatum]|uniref:Protein phosphatase 2C n=1 Tax=Oesophagostomum dentatum TaxID=61180 RepID=A0A0B1T878_OESDE|nr:protein phosphatase 2C [Oesophagostomum dentatum]